MAESSVGDLSTIINENALQVAIVPEAERAHYLKQGAIPLTLLGKPVLKNWPSTVTKQEQHCLRLLLQDLPAKAIGDALAITENAVNRHLASLRKKFNCRTNSKLAILADQANR